MAAEQGRSAEAAYAELLNRGRAFVQGKVAQIEGRFPTLKDGSLGIQVGRTLGLNPIILRPDSSLELVEYRTQKPIEGEHDYSHMYLERGALGRIEQEVDSVFYGWGELFKQAGEVIDSEGVDSDERQTHFSLPIMELWADGRSPKYKKTQSLEVTYAGIPFPVALEQLRYNKSGWEDTTLINIMGIVDSASPALIFTLGKNYLKDSSGALVKDERLQTVKRIVSASSSRIA